MRNLFETFFSVTEALEESAVSYAIIGGFAMAFHDVVRATRDIDILILSPELPDVEEILLKLGLRHSGRPFPIGKDPSFTFHRFVSFTGTDHVIVDVICSSDRRIEEIVRESIVAKTDRGPVRIARENDLVWLKQLRLSPQDQIDIDRLREGKNEQD